MDSFYKNNEIRDFEIKIFASDSCKSFIPMTFVNIQGKLNVNYHLEGYKEINFEKLENPYQLLEIIEKIAFCMKEAHNHLILYSRYILTKEVIYIDQINSNLKIKFVPSNDEGKTEEFSVKVKSLLRELGIKNIRCLEYIDMIIKKLDKYDLSMQSLFNYIGELKREAYLCGWGN